jgi:hypothetical protein
MSTPGGKLSGLHRIPVDGLNAVVLQPMVGAAKVMIAKKPLFSGIRTGVV